MRQKLGQHFLKNEKILKNIVETLELKKGDVVVEIGPGHGELTQEIIGDFENKGIKNYKLVLIEKDRQLVDGISYMVDGKDKTKIEIIQGDVLKILPSLHANYQLLNTNYKLIGNIPYYITGHLLRTIGELKNKPELTVLLIQKEVAQRICAKPPRMNLLSASVQFWAEPKIIQNVAKGNFNPPPEVESSVILLKTKDNNEKLLLLDDRQVVEAEKEYKYYRFIRVLFKQPRKTALNNLVSGGYKKEDILEWLKKNKIKENCRPQDFGVEMLISMALEL